MARKPRHETEPGVAHVYARGNDRQRIFLDDADRARYVELLGEATRYRRWRCLSYCLMDNHVHLLIETREPNLGAGIGWAHGRYAAHFNRRHARTGHVFGDRYGTKTITSDAHLLAAARYIAHNPVDAALCRRPEDWAWSSHALLMTQDAPAWLDVARLLEFFGAAGGDPLRRYVDFVADEQPSDRLGDRRCRAAGRRLDAICLSATNLATSSR